MKYFAIENEYWSELRIALSDMGYIAIKYITTQFAVLCNNELSEEDYLVIKLKFNIIEPNTAQLAAAKQLNNIDWIQAD